MDLANIGNIFGLVRNQEKRPKLIRMTIASVALVICYKALVYILKFKTDLIIEVIQT